MKGVELLIRVRDAVDGVSCMGRSQSRFSLQRDCCGDVVIFATREAMAALHQRQQDTDAIRHGGAVGAAFKARATALLPAESGLPGAPLLGWLWWGLSAVAGP